MQVLRQDCLWDISTIVLDSFLYFSRFPLPVSDIKVPPMLPSHKRTDITTFKPFMDLDTQPVLFIPDVHYSNLQRGSHVQYLSCLCFSMGWRGRNLVRLHAANWADSFDLWVGSLLVAYRIRVQMRSRIPSPVVFLWGWDFYCGDFSVPLCWHDIFFFLGDTVIPTPYKLLCQL